MATENRKGPGGISIVRPVNIGSFIQQYPLKRVKQILKKTKKASVRERSLPAHVVVYYVIVLSLFLNESYREVLNWMFEGLNYVYGRGIKFKIPVKSAITQARQRLGVEPLKAMYDEFVKPIATEKTKGAWYRKWLVASLDGSTMDITDTPENEQEFGRSKGKNGDSAYPKLRFTALIENGTRALFGSYFAAYNISELALARKTIKHLGKGMLCMADRNFFGYEFFKLALETGADILWRLKKTTILPAEQILADGSYLSTFYPSDRARKKGIDGISVRVIEYRLQGVKEAEPYYRLVTTILEPEEAPAAELGALYHERWQIETALKELKTYLPGANILLRSKTPELVKQEFYAFMLAYFAVRGIMHEAALEGNLEPDKLSFLNAVRVIKRKLPQFIIFPPAAVA